MRAIVARVTRTAPARGPGEDGPVEGAPQVVVGAAVVVDGRVLAAQRAEPPDMRGRWELPGGSVEPGESETAALARELREELALPVTVGERVGADIPVRGRRGTDLVLRFYRCTPLDGAQPQALEHLALRWVGAEELDDLDWLPSDRALLPDLRAAVGTDPSAAVGTDLTPPGRASRPSPDPSR
jgi:8-oxo-dGTP diphosphatase